MSRKHNGEYSIADIHCHVLYGVDDGAGDYDTSMRMLRIAYENGVRRMILTPHYKPRRHNASTETIMERIDELRTGIAAEGMDIELYPGNEIMYHDEIHGLLDDGKVLTLAGSRYILIEFMPVTDYIYIYNALMKSMSNGYIPILAHIERYECMLKEYRYAEELHRSGVYIQVNAGSVEGRYGREAKRYTRRLIADGLVDLMASDAHDTGKRSPAFDKAVRYLAGHYGYEYIRRIMWDNPAAITEDRYI